MKTLLMSLCIAMAALSVFLYRNNARDKKELRMIQDMHDITQYRYNAVISYMLAQEHIAGYKLTTSMQLRNKNGEAVKLSEILSVSINSIMYIPLASCSSCNENIFKNLPRTIELTGGKLNIICPISDFNNIIILSEYKVTGNNLFAADEPLVNREIFDPSGPCLINVFRNGLIKSIFIIDNNDVKFFNDYIQLSDRI